MSWPAGAINGSSSAPAASSGWASGAINGPAAAGGATPTTRPVTPPGLTLTLSTNVPSASRNGQRGATPVGLTLALAVAAPSFKTNAVVALGTFDFAPGTTVWEEMQPPEVSVVSFRGWDFTAKPSTPYRPTYKLSMRGMRWYLNDAGNALDTTTNPHINAGRLRAFYIANRTWASFYYTHEVLGTALYKFVTPVQIPPAIANSGGLIDTFEVMIVQVNPGYQ